MSALLEDIAKRKSVRAFQSTKISQAEIDQLLEAARWAPSSMNEQPWRYIVATRGEAINQKVLACLAPNNQTWAANASVLIVSLARKTFQKNDTPNRHALYDTGAANALLSIQAAHMGLQVHQMGGFVADALRSALNIGDEYEIAVVLSVGYPDSPDSLPEALKVRELAPRVRKELTEIIL